MKYTEICPECGSKVTIEIAGDDEMDEVKESSINLSNVRKTSTFSSRVNIEDLERNFRNNKKEKKEEETVTLRCEKCGNSWTRKLDGNKVVYYSDEQVEDAKKRALQCYHKNIEFGFGYFLGFLFFGYLTYLCVSYCINNDSTYMFHQEAFLWIEEQDIEKTNFWWYICLLLAIPLGFGTLGCLAGSVEGLFVEQSPKYKEIDNMSTGQFRNSKYMEVFLKK